MDTISYRFLDMLRRRRFNDAVAATLADKNQAHAAPRRAADAGAEAAANETYEARIQGRIKCCLSRLARKMMATEPLSPALHLAPVGDPIFLAALWLVRGREARPGNDNYRGAWPSPVPVRRERYAGSAYDLEPRHPIALMQRFVTWAIACALYALMLVLGRRHI
ncbi:hypothetical protein FJY94_03070 [Candidatus Kaiserbacteria bacterium]|nr:hypothetical protein [Candidatus Kaiserbacteria bacterium]